MTVNELVLHIADAMNLSSQEAKARIGRNINVRYKRITSAIGLVTSRREEVSKTATIGSQYVTFSGIEKIDTVFRKVNGKNVILTELTNDEMLATSMQTEPPTAFTIFSLAPKAVTIAMNCLPTVLVSAPDIAFTLYAQGLADVSTLTSNDSPLFPESFHDIIIHGVMADEYRKMEKPLLAREEEMYYEMRLSDLKMFIAKSAYMQIFAGKHAPSMGWWDTGRRS